MELGLYFALIIIEFCVLSIAFDINSIKKELQDANRRREKEDA